MCVTVTEEPLQPVQNVKMTVKEGATVVIIRFRLVVQLVVDRSMRHMNTTAAMNTLRTDANETATVVLEVVLGARHGKIATTQTVMVATKATNGIVKRLLAQPICAVARMELRLLELGMIGRFVTEMENPDVTVAMMGSSCQHIGMFGLASQFEQGSMSMRLLIN